MRSIILSALALVSLGLGSCKNAIDIPYSDAQEALTALLVANTSDAEHTMRISHTNIGRFDPASDAGTELLVDGVPVPITNISTTKAPGQYQVRYAFKPKQRLELRVQHGGKRVHAEAVMPDLPSLGSVDYTPFKETSQHGEDDLTKWSITLQDHADIKEHYRIAILEEMVFVDAKTQQEVSPRGAVWLWLDTDSDYILSDGTPKNRSNHNEDMDIDEIFGRRAPNPYHIFSDRLFEGREVTINPISKSLPRRVAPERYTVSVEVSPGKMEFRELNYAYHRYTVHLHSLSEDTFRYYQTLGVSLDADEESPLETPIQIHTNIRGGAGILGAYAVVTKVIQKRFTPSQGTW